MSSERGRLIVREGALIGWLLICLCLFIAFFTYSPDDPGWSHTGGRDDIHNAAGATGAWLADVFFSLFGYMAFLFPALLALRAWNVFQARKTQPEPFDWIIFTLRFVGLALVMASATALTAMHHGGAESVLPFGVGGLMGDSFGQAVTTGFNHVGGTLILVGVFLFGVTIFTDLSWLAVIDAIGRWSLVASDWAQGKFSHYQRTVDERKTSEEALRARQETVEENSAAMSSARNRPSSPSRLRPNPACGCKRKNR